ncbi:HAD-IA family hydrolase [Thetidibacter halocola]|uniref:HAD-IA family hydrolase n=1 Tax=Thetidibacter halocola TaxID=2827239 RepID=A0A8J7WIH0_9RHOB|nr:HAD-IA family hydrolase [Thetidibacter halocola]MBS0125634.1 HAD-IA family hydrolase [Thetidibacter halocola]
MTLRLVIFDVDGTLVDSQADILASMEAAFAEIGRPAPARTEVLGVVGLSLPGAIARLAGDESDDRLARMVEAYKTSYARLRHQNGAASSPLYDGIRPLLEALHARDDLLLGIATGKSRRGLEALLDTLDLRRFFVTAQCADDHPSKPHPSMLLTCLAETGIDAGRAVMIGDTSFDIDMARAARIRSVGVTWGYHPAPHLSGADRVVEDTAALGRVLDDLLELAT